MKNLQAVLRNISDWPSVSINGLSANGEKVPWIIRRVAWEGGGGWNMSSLFPFIRSCLSSYSCFLFISLFLGNSLLSVFVYLSFLALFLSLRFPFFCILFPLHSSLLISNFMPLHLFQPSHSLFIRPYLLLFSYIFFRFHFHCVWNKSI